MSTEKFAHPDRSEILAFWAAVMRGEESDRSIDRRGEVTEVPPTLHARLRASELLHAELARVQPAEVRAEATARRRLYEVK